MRNCAALIALGCALAACAERRPERFPIEVRAESGPGIALGGARTWAAGRDLGATDAAGRLRASLGGFEGDRVSLAFACPPGHRADTATREVPLRRLERTGTNARPLVVSLRCEPLARQVALVVRTEGVAPRSLPIVVLDRKIGQTDATGVAHIALDAPPHATLQVKVVTAAYPKLEPRDPVQTFRLGEEDAVLLFAQAFAEPRARRARPRSAPIPPKPVPSPRPYRIR